jgi:hypothetical protein
MESDKL